VCVTFYFKNQITEITFSIRRQSRRKRGIMVFFLPHAWDELEKLSLDEWELQDLHELEVQV
jgi:hypothetical protein